MDRNTIHLSKWVDAHYSPDDGGWYVHDYRMCRSSTAIYPTFAEAQDAWRDGLVEWDS